VRRALVAWLIVALTACGPKSKGAAEPAKGPLTPAQIAARSLPSVVLIVVGDHLGTGFVIWPDGRIATNLHVIVGGATITVKLPDGSQSSDVEVMAIDPDHDLAVIRVNRKGLPALPLGDSDGVHPGDRVVAIGHPLGLGDTVSDGLVSAVRDLGLGVKVLQLSAPISQGSSGGPVLDEHGQVVGVSFLVSKEGQNLNFAVPSNYLKPMLLSDKGMPFSEFVARTQRPVEAVPLDADPPGAIHYEAAVLDDCAMDQMQLVYDGINDAIKIGAPLYNDGQIEACYRVYEGAALAFEQKLQGCVKLKAALADGRTKAAAEPDWNKRAWAMRHMFDGLQAAMVRKAKQQSP
jgi:S1-C subfamily serine protease